MAEAKTYGVAVSGPHKGELTECRAQDKSTCPYHVEGSHQQLTEEQFYEKSEQLAAQNSGRDSAGSDGNLQKKMAVEIPAGTPEDKRWLYEAREDIPQWESAMKPDRWGKTVDWDLIRSLDYYKGVGVGADCPDALEGIKKDFETQDKLHYAYQEMYKQFQYGDGRGIESYRLARAIAYSNRRLNDEIGLLKQRVEAEGGEIPKSPMEIAAEKRNASYKKWRDSQDAAAAGKREKTPEEIEKDRKRQERNAQWLPGQDLDKIVNIDFETTGYEDMGYIIDAGWDSMDISPSVEHEDKTSDADKNHQFRQGWYSGNGAYDIRTRRYGVPPARQQLGNPFEYMNHVSIDSIKNLKPLDEDPAAQKELLDAMTSGAPYVAHNAQYELKQMCANVDGFMEAYRRGDVVIIDTMRTSQMWPLPPDVAEKKKRLGGRNSLDTYMKIWDVIPEDKEELHLGLEDAHGMGEALRKHMKYCYDTKQGPWDPNAPKTGVGGKSIGRRRH